ncbi:MAG: NAD(P)H-hydrate dehydratase [Omnitrophica WOR_2 bacterium RIFCSPHIGHO2_02_FULL_68_15]|nr:MAG: NAD(P)H-hydrate dehydratase [Omnitrophica WOR_2 bacterium RIFCSPHIGHO2_02_FULL_68_15]
MSDLRVFRRRADSYKGDYGRVLVVGGSVGLTGAPVLCALGALRGGAGLVTVAVPESIYFVVATHLVEAMPTPLPEAVGGCLSSASLAPILALAARADVVALGPGLSSAPATQSCVRRLLPRLRRPLVLDADGLNAVAGRPELVRCLPAPAILTPHPGELARLLGRPVAAIQRDRLVAAKAASKAWRAVVVLKGHRTVIADPSGKALINRTGNPGMATGGMGDVLAGLIAALVGQGITPFDAAILGARLHGLAGDLAAREVGPVGLLASDVAARLPAAIQRLV